MQTGFLVLRLKPHAQLTPGVACRDEAVEQLSTGPLINEVYYTTAGIDVKSAAVITRGREAAVNIWKIPTDKTGFFLLQTNYDHWKPVPAYDDRRNPGIEHMVELGESGMGVDGLYSVLTEWYVHSGMPTTALLTFGSV